MGKLRGLNGAVTATWVQVQSDTQEFTELLLVVVNGPLAHRE